MPAAEPVWVTDEAFALSSLQQPRADWYAVGTVGLDRPSGATGSVQAKVEGGTIADSDTLVVALWANTVGPWRLDQCIVRRAD